MGNPLSRCISWVARKYRGGASFRIEAANSRYDPNRPGDAGGFQEGRLVVLGVGGCFFETLTLCVTAAGETGFERINVGFARKRFGRLTPASPDEIRVDGLDAASPEFSSEEDGAGGYNGHFAPARRLPADGKLWLEVGFKISAHKEENYHVVFRNLLGRKDAGAASIKVVFRNREPIDK